MVFSGESLLPKAYPVAARLSPMTSSRISTAAGANLWQARLPPIIAPPWLKECSPSLVGISGLDG